MFRIPAILFLLIILLTPLAAQSPWTPGTYYARGVQVTYQGVTYSCLQSHTAIVSWEPVSTPALWQVVNPRGTQCTSVPGAPRNLAASGTTSTGTTLSWTASTVSTGCNVSSYTVYRNGAAIGTATGTSFAVTGLAPSTSYQFTVSATDAAGVSTQSTAVTVTTTAGSGGGGSGGGACAAAWSATAVYTGGMTASVNGTNYKANWWTQGQNPATNSGPAGSGQPWTATGTCAPCTAIPGVPGTPAASGTTAFSTVLNWSAATIPANCSLTNYTVLRDGVAVGTTTSTTFTAYGLTPQSAYSFAVTASDAAGTSAASAPVSVTTPASSGGASAKTFAPYIDMSMTASEQLTTIQQQSGIRVFTLAFVLSGGGCAPAWGGNIPITNDLLSNGVSMQTLINQVRAAGGDVIVSFGGANGTELALACSTVSQLQAAYQAVIARYGVTMLDFDVEGGAVADMASVHRRNQALVALKAANPALKISFTLPVLPTGLVNTGVAILNAIQADGLAVDVINVMAMDYGASVDNGGQMGLNATLAAAATHNQIVAAGLTASVGVTPMIGVNDVASEVFRLADAQQLVDFANANSYVSRLAFWSVGRDNGSCAGTNWASATCSGVAQTQYQFSGVFGGFR